MEKEMLEYHDSNPNLKDADRCASLEVWRSMLRATAKYLRGELKTILMADVIADAGGLSHEVKDVFMVQGS